MSIKSIKKRCRYCRKTFCPDSRAGDRQKACSSEPCRKARKNQAQKQWVKKNAGYFQGRYEMTRQWLDKHPGYLKAYRNAHPEYVEQNRQRQKQRRKVTGKNWPKSRVDIQDGLITQPTDIIKDRLRFVDIDIQDGITRQVIVPVYVSRYLGRVDIQDTMVIRPLSRYTSGIMITAKELQELRRDCYG